MRTVGNQFLRLGLDHVFEKGVRQLFVTAGRRDHQVVDPPRGVFLRDDLSDGEVRFAKVIGIQRPAHRQNNLMILEQVG